MRAGQSTKMAVLSIPVDYWSTGARGREGCARAADLQRSRQTKTARTSPVHNSKCRRCPLFLASVQRCCHNTAHLIFQVVVHAVVPRFVPRMKQPHATPTLHQPWQRRTRPVFSFVNLKHASSSCHAGVTRHLKHDTARQALRIDRGSSSCGSISRVVSRESWRV